MSDRPALDALVAGFGKTTGASAGTAAGRRHGECSAIGCRALVLPYVLFCDRCWLLVPSDLKRIVGKHHRPGKKPSAALERVLTQVLAELLEFKTTGHFKPRDGSFMWDDDPPAPVGVDVPLFPRGERNEGHE